MDVYDFNASVTVRITDCSIRPRVSQSFYVTIICSGKHNIIFYY